MIRKIITLIFADALTKRNVEAKKMVVTKNVVNVVSIGIKMDVMTNAINVRNTLNTIWNYVY